VGPALALLCVAQPVWPVEAPLVDPKGSGTGSTITREQIEKLPSPGKIEDIVKTAPGTPASGGSLTVPIDATPQNIFCLEGGGPAGSAQMDEIDKIEVLKGGSTAEIGRAGGQIYFITRSSPEKIKEAFANAPFQLCPDIPIQPDSCTIMTPLTAFRGHDHKDDHGHPHDHDAPDPPWSWGTKPPETVIRWAQE
jgi:hypothetical protein